MIPAGQRLNICQTWCLYKMERKLLDHTENNYCRGIQGITPVSTEMHAHFSAGRGNGDELLEKTNRKTQEICGPQQTAGTYTFNFGKATGMSGNDEFQNVSFFLIFYPLNR